MSTVVWARWDNLDAVQPRVAVVLASDRAPTPSKAAYCIRWFRVVVIEGEHIKIINFSASTEYVGEWWVWVRKEHDGV